MNMHADENSDGVIVPEKRPNKESLPSTEAVEGRTPPKGNGDETAAARTLRRDNASNGLSSSTASFRQSELYTRCPVTVSTSGPEGGARCVSSARRDLYGGGWKRPSLP